MLTNSKSGAALFAGGLIFTLVVMLWPVFMVLSEVDGDMMAQLASIAASPGLYRLNFVIASLIAPALAVIMAVLAFGIETKERTPILNILGLLFLTTYVTLVTVSYASQYTLFPSLLSQGSPGLELWYFNNPQSIPYFLNQLGYTFFALSALLIGFKLLYEQGLAKAVGILLWLSGVLSIIAFIGLSIDSPALNFTSIISGLTTVPMGMIVIFWGKRLRRRA